MNKNEKRKSTIDNEGMYHCKECGRVFSRYGMGWHFWRVHGKGQHIDSNKSLKNGTRIIWNKGLTKETNASVAKMGKTMSAKYKDLVSRGKFVPRGYFKWTEEKKKAWSIKQSLHNQGGKTKWYTVGNVKVQGTWERDFALKMNEENIKWIRGRPIAYYKDKKLKHYSPDFFLLSSNKFIEIKGFWRDEDKEKMKIIFEQHPYLEEMLIIIESSDYREIMNDTNRFLKVCSL